MLRMVATFALTMKLRITTQLCIVNSVVQVCMPFVGVKIFTMTLTKFGNVANADNEHVTPSALFADYPRVWWSLFNGICICWTKTGMRNGLFGTMWCVCLLAVKWSGVIWTDFKESSIRLWRKMKLTSISNAAFVIRASSVKMQR